MVNTYLNSSFFFVTRMVLLVQGVVQDEPPLDTRTLYLNHPVLRDSASQLLTISTKVVGPIGLLYVCQREMAVTVPHDSMCIYEMIIRVCYNNRTKPTFWWNSHTFDKRILKSGHDPYSSYKWVVVKGREAEKKILHFSTFPSFFLRNRTKTYWSYSGIKPADNITFDLS